MNYKETLDFLYSKLPIYQRTGEAAYKKDTKNIKIICNHINNPHEKIKFIHIGGTNGKGSTANILSEILKKQKLKIGLYTSPHYQDFRERIQINNKKIDKKFVTNFIQKINPIFKQINPSFFEVTVALAFYYFYKKKVDLAIVEVGLGGRLDSTNIINPIVSVITNVSLDHTNILGNNIKKIAYEKAGIIKTATPVIIGRKQKEIKNIFINQAKKENSKIIFAKNYNLNIKPKYQNENINTVINILELLKNQGYNIKLNTIISKIDKEKEVIGRWNIINTAPLTIMDSAHNIDGIKNIIKETHNIKHKTLHIVFGCSNDKNVKNLLTILPKKAKYYFCQANVIRSYSYKKFAELAASLKLSYNLIKDPKKALKQAKDNATKDDLIIIFGSIFIIGEVL